MRISSLLRVLEDSALKAGKSLAAATAELSREVSLERRARELYNAERRDRLGEFRTIVEAQDIAAMERMVAACTPEMAAQVAANVRGKRKAR